MNLHLLIGADEKTLEMCSSAEKTKFALLGSLILVPIVTASLAAIFAARYFTSNVLVITGVTLVWALVMFVIERAMLASLRPGKMNFAAWFRVLVAVAMSAIVSELLMLALFRTDISAVMARKHAEETRTVLDAGDDRIMRLKEELAMRKEALNAKEKQYIDEIDGRTGSGIKGFGPSAKAKQEALAKEQAEFDVFKAQVEEKITSEEIRREQSVAETVAAQQCGLLESIATLNEMKEERPVIGIILWVLRAFLLGIELMPLVIRVSFSGQQYFDLVDIEDEISIKAGRSLIDKKLELKKLQDEYAIESEKLSVNNALDQLKLKKVGEKAVMESQQILDTVLDFQKVDAVAAEKVKGRRQEGLLKDIDARYSNFLQDTKEMMDKRA